MKKLRESNSVLISVIPVKYDFLRLKLAAVR